ncbi:MAG: DegV family protein, partial [Oscillospiraceae bacterium]|nr:DegV family protein [Oscillospiraceae bacterium]
MKIAVMTDTNSGMSVPEGEKSGIFVLPMPVIIHEKNYLEGVDITSQTLFQALRDGIPVSTSQPSPASLTQLWEQIFAQGYDEIVYLPMTSGLSGSCSTAIQLAKDYGGRVQVVDHHRISLPQKYAVLDAKQMADRGMIASEIRDRLEQNGLNAMVYIAVDTLEYLKKSGRVTTAGAAIATVMNIKPILSIHGGKLDAFAKVRGIRNCEKKMIEALRHDVETDFAGFPKEKLVIATAGSFETRESAEEWRQSVQDAFPEFQVPYEPL